MIDFRNTYSKLPENFYQRISPVPVKKPRLLKLNGDLARDLGLHLEKIPEDKLADIFSGNTILPGSEPLAQAYAGHQFGHFVPQLGDGRAILLGEIVDRQGTLKDIQLKGSGPTRFSRKGDGRAALGPAMREYILGEAMFHLGIPTTRVLALVETGEEVMREEPLPGAVLTRVASSHIRIGTFEYFANQADLKSIKTLADYVINRHYPHLGESKDKYRELFQEVLSRQAQLISQWMQVGFIHGVMNTDNMTLSGETIDYGPCAFLDEYNPSAVFSSIDSGGRYSFGNQPVIGQWNLSILAGCLLPLFDEDEKKAISFCNDALETFIPQFQTHFRKGMFQKFGIKGSEQGDEKLVQEFLDLMEDDKVDYTLGFRYLSQALTEDEYAKKLASLFVTKKDKIEEWIGRWHNRLKGDLHAATQLMLKSNPAFIPRNHRVEQAIQETLKTGKTTKMDDLLRVVSRPFEDQPDLVHMMQPPLPHEKVSQTFCGT